MSHFNLVYDRTFEDVVEAIRLNNLGWADMVADEREAYLDGLKGSYTITDLNRVESAVNEIANYLNALPGIIAEIIHESGISPDPTTDVPYNYPFSLTVKMDWKFHEIPTVHDEPERVDLKRYLANIYNLASRFVIEHELPDTMERLGYESANEIERTLAAEYQAALDFLEAVKERVGRTVHSFIGCNEMGAGEI